MEEETGASEAQADFDAEASKKEWASTKRLEEIEDYLHMFPPFGVHVADVPRYQSGFRKWHAES